MIKLVDIKRASRIQQCEVPRIDTCCKSSALVVSIKLDVNRFMGALVDRGICPGHAPGDRKWHVD